MPWFDVVFLILYGISTAANMIALGYTARKFYKGEFDFKNRFNFKNMFAAKMVCVLMIFTIVVIALIYIFVLIIFSFPSLLHGRLLAVLFFMRKSRVTINFSSCLQPPPFCGIMNFGQIKFHVGGFLIGR